MKPYFGVLGGDRRQSELARLLRQDGHTVYTWGLEAWGESESLEETESAQTVILPLPVRDGDGRFNCTGLQVQPEALLERFRPGQLLLAGKVDAALAERAASRGLTLVDYFAREELTVANAAITAEGAIQVAMEHLDRTLLGMDCLVMGLGRIGTLLCRRLQGLGAHVWAFARRPESRAWAAACGYAAVRSDDLAEELGHFPVVFNTIPSLILDEALLRRLPAGCLCVELASVPGMDLAAAESLGHTAVWARSLPGKLAPVTAAAAIRDTVYHILEERGDSV